MRKVDFLTAGQSEDAAIHFVCELVGKLYLKSLKEKDLKNINLRCFCLLYTSPSPRDGT